MTVDELGGTVGDVLLDADADLRQAVRQILAHYTVKEVVHGIAHITGGGLHENLERILPEGRRAVIRRGSWPVPPVFTWLQRLGEVDQAEMDQVFNMGIGLVLVVSPYYADSIRPTCRLRPGKLADRPNCRWTIGRGLGVEWRALSVVRGQLSVVIVL